MSEVAGEPAAPSVRRADAAARLFGWLGLTVGFVAARPDHAAETCVALVGAATWVAAHRVLGPPLRRGPPVKRILLLFVLVAGLVLLVASGCTPGWASPWVRVLFRTGGCVILSLDLAYGLTATALLGALGVLPVPASLRRGLEWTLRSLPVLVGETDGMARAVVIRRGRAGMGATLALACALPRVWIPRVLGRAERLAAAMLVRGYEGETLASPREAGEAGNLEPRLALGAVLVASAVVAMRWLSP